MLVLFVGDAHGNMPYMQRALQVAQEAGAGLVIQVGDFGFWPKTVWAGWVNKMYKKAKMPLWVIDGNHDYPDGFRMYLKPIDEIKPGLTSIPRGAVKVIGSTKIGFMGSAVSIDQQYRKHGVSWWPSEMMTQDDAQVAIANGPVDIWVTHDAVELPPYRKPHRFPPWLEDQLSVQRELMRKVYDALKPQLHIHGHHHVRYAADGKYGRVIGLADECNGGLFLMEIPDE